MGKLLSSWINCLLYLHLLSWTFILRWSYRCWLLARQALRDMSRIHIWFNGVSFVRDDILRGFDCSNVLMYS
jgi:hypothetical protein